MSTSFMSSVLKKTGKTHPFGLKSASARQKRQSFL
jgi:hypothetical protein